jgi:hypothetical protein
MSYLVFSSAWTIPRGCLEQSLPSNVPNNTERKDRLPSTVVGC